jgi:subtilisin family serine protease
MTRYAILYEASATGAQRGAVTTQHKEPPQPELRFEDLSAEDVADLRRDPAARAVAPAMPTSLIEPVTTVVGGHVPAPAPVAWGVEAVDAVRERLTGQGVRVAVLDTGIEENHLAFAGVSLVQADFSGDGLGDRHGHGTHCAGTVFGRDVGQRIGVARGVTQAWIGKVLDDRGRGDTTRLLDGLMWAFQARVNIISMSVGINFAAAVKQKMDAGLPLPFATSDALAAFGANLRLFDALVAMFGANAPYGASPLVVAAAGNDSQRNVSYSLRMGASMPAAANGVLAVGAVGRQGQHLRVADFSNTGVVVCAPGVDILSAGLGGSLVTKSGTSMACPHVAGVAALWCEAMMQVGARVNADRLHYKLQASADRQKLVPGSHALDVGDGLVTAPNGRN